MSESVGDGGAAELGWMERVVVVFVSRLVRSELLAQLHPRLQIFDEDQWAESLEWDTSDLLLPS